MDTFINSGYGKNLPATPPALQTSMADAFVRTLRQVFRRQGAAPCAVFLWAAERGHVGIVRNLLQGLRRDKSAHAVYASEALQRAAAEGHADVVSLLIAEVPYPVPNFLQKACRWAIYGGHTQAAKVIIADTRFDANVTNRDDVSLLQLAARLGEAEIVGTLVSRIERDNGLAANRSGILLALPEEEGGTNIPRELSQALRTAKIYGHNAVIEMLSQHGIVEPSREATSGTAIRLPVHQGGASPALQPAAS